MFDFSIHSQSQIEIRKINYKNWHDGKGQELLQDIELDLDIGDTVLMGKFKYKKVVVNVNKVYIKINAIFIHTLLTYMYAYKQDIKYN